VEARLLGPKFSNTRCTCDGGLMTVKTHSQRSISGLECAIKHEVLRQQNHPSDTWLELNNRLYDEEALCAYCDSSVVNGCFHLGVCIFGMCVYA
jgi:hypothetical protein